MSTGTPELRALVARLQWPVPTTKWWVMQELAVLLLSPPLRQSVEAMLLQSLGSCLLESDVVERLAVFWLAKQRDSAYAVPPNIGALIKARSPLSDLFMKVSSKADAPLGTYSTPVELAPSTFPGSVTFNAAEGRVFPRILRTTLREAAPSIAPLLFRQLAFEWEKTEGRTQHPPQDVDYFLRQSRFDQTGQFFTRESARGRSAYLRTVALCQDHFRAPPSQVENLVKATLPVEPALAWLRPVPPDPGMEPLVPEVTSDAVSKYIVNKMERMRANGVVAAMSWSAETPDGTMLNIDAVLWQGPKAAWEAESTSFLLEDRSIGFLSGAGLDVGGKVEYFETENAAQSVASRVVRPLAGVLFPLRLGYTQSELLSRGIFGPCSPENRPEVCCAPDGPMLRFDVDQTTLGHFGFWTSTWEACHQKQAGPHIGTYLRLTPEGLDELLGGKKAPLFYVWTCLVVQEDGVNRKAAKQVLSGAEAWS